STLTLLGIVGAQKHWSQISNPLRSARRRQAVRRICLYLGLFIILRQSRASVVAETLGIADAQDWDRGVEMRSKAINDLRCRGQADEQPPDLFPFPHRGQLGGDDLRGLL